MSYKIIRVGVCLAIGLMASTTAVRADGFQITFTGANNPAITGDLLITADPTGASGQYLVDGIIFATITDPSTGSATPFFLTGINNYADADNILYIPPTSDPGFVDFGGISFNSADGTSFNIGGGSPSGYYLNESVNNPGGSQEDLLASFTLTRLGDETPPPAGAPAPLAGAGLLSFFGAGGVAMRKRAKRILGSLLA